MNSRSHTMSMPKGPFRPKDNHRKPNRPQKPKAWSHQNDLTAAKGKKIEIQIGLNSITGTLIDADQFTIKVQLLASTQHSQSTVTYFKSALTGFSIKG